MCVCARVFWVISPPFLSDVTLWIVCVDDGLCVNGASVVVLLYRNWTVLQRCAEITDLLGTVMINYDYYFT